MSPSKKRIVRAHRVNARLDAATYQQLTALEAQTRLSTTDVVREALRRMHAELASTTGRARTALDDLVGRYEGAPADLSERAKEHLTSSLGRKHTR